MYDMSGTVKKICDLQTFPSGFTKRDLIVEEEKDGKWPNVVAFTFKKDATGKLDGLKPGDRVKVGFAVDGREWTDPRTGAVRYFTDLTGLFLEKLSDIPAGDGPSQVPPGPVGGGSTSSYIPPVDAPSIDDEDLPF
ncbi:MAG: DUF3127 domain-containing protein [Kiritimatiellae bacterium]|nr:DUF3127 domain-containing protein [Kiritimatiellia bacterium]